MAIFTQNLHDGWMMLPMQLSKRIFASAAIALAALSVAASPASAEVASAWAEEEQTAVRLIVDRDGLGETGTVRAGLEFRMQPGWKVYWRSPGDAGFPPQPDFSGSTNTEVGPLAWPVPSRFAVLGLQTLGYEDRVVLPFDLSAQQSDRPAWVAATINYLTCKDVCIPYTAEIDVKIPAGGGAPTGLAHAISQFDAQVPRSAASARLDVTDMWTEASNDAVHLVVRSTSEIPFRSPDLYFEGQPDLGFGEPQTTLTDDGRNATLRVAVTGYRGTPAEAAEALDGTPLTLTVVDGRRAAEIDATVGAPRPFDSSAVIKSSAAPVGQSILLMLAFAFLGGLILNLMPCVLPVLSIKFLSLVKHGGGAPTAARVSFIASAAGIVFAFMLLAAALIGIKATGASIGWGIQFQQPWFLIAMALLVTLFACNLWGFFEVRLPGVLGSLGHKGSQGTGVGGSFLQGMFATLLATPCSAPFLGTAVGFALARGSVEIAAIFLFLGLGLAAPYLLIAAVPSLATRLPAPGPWMMKLKIVLGFALAATAIWLLSVIAAAAGMLPAIVVGGVLIAICLWLGPVVRTVPEIARATPIVLLFATVGAISGAYVGDSRNALTVADTQAGKIAWAPFDRASLESLTAAGKIVFVDVTADWCITCQVNKRLVMEQGRILELLNSPDIVAMQADWTRPNPEIAAYLASFDRYGIPFNAIYGPSAPNGVPLPELLTEEIVLGGFRAAVPDQLAAQFQ